MPLRSSHKRQQRQRTCLPHRLTHSLSKNAGTSGLPPSWPVCSPIHLRSPGTSLKTSVPEAIRLIHLQNYLVQFKFRSSSPCPHYITRNHMYPIPQKKSFPTSRLGLLDFLSPTNKTYSTRSHIFCISRPFWLMLTSPHKRTYPPFLVVVLAYLVVYVSLSLSSLVCTSVRSRFFCSFGHSTISTIPLGYRTCTAASDQRMSKTTRRF